MASEGYSSIRNLAPKGYSFDAYNELNSPNSRDRPFFEEGSVKIGNYFLHKHFGRNGDLILSFSSVCPNGKILFKDYSLSLQKFVALLQGAIANKSDFITFDIETFVTTNPTNCGYNCGSKNQDCMYIIKNKPDIVTAAVSFEPTDIKNALSAHFGITYNNNNKGGTTMKTNNMKKLFGMNFEFGMSHDSNIAATMLGVAVKNRDTGNWYIYDRATGTRKNYANMKFGDFRVLLVPDRVLNPGDLVKMDSKYYYVQAVSGGTATMLDAADGIIVQKLLDECFIPGMNFYTKVVALDPRTMFDPSNQTDMSRNVLSAILMMQWSKGESEFSLDSINDDSFNGLGMLLLMGGNNDMAQKLPMLVAMGAAGGGNGDVSDMVQMMVLSQILSGGTPGAATGTDPFSSLFGGIPGLAPAAAPTAAATGNVVCSSCGAEYPAGTNFCAKCGGKTQPKGKHCTQCGAVLMDGALFCQNCGKKVVSDTCPQCGSKIAVGSNFCTTCGHNLNGVVVPAVPVPAPAPAPVSAAPSATQVEPAATTGT